MKILTPTITSHKLNHLLQIQKKAESLPPLSVGEVVEAEIVKSARYGKALILLKNSPVIAYSGLPLSKGEKIAVRVAQLHPGVVLRIVQNEISQKSMLMDYLRFYRSNPKALFDVSIEGIDRFNPEKLEELVGPMEKKDVRNIQNILKSLIFSKESLKNPLFLKDYVHKLGYLMEKEQGGALKRRAGATMNASQNLKGFLLKVSSKLQPLMEIGNFPAAEKLAEFARSSLHAIESHQVVNYLFQEYEGKYMFQIPLLFPENMGMAEIFVKFWDQKNKGHRKEKNVLFLLNMDALGDVVVEAKITVKKISCVLKCGNENICDFIRPFMKELEDKLTALGYEIAYLKCVTEKDNLKIKSEHSEFQNLFALESVDILA